jgi:hypothetical protein
MKLNYHPEATRELEKAVQDYEKSDPELADNLIDAVLMAEAEIEEGPHRFALAEDTPVGFAARNRSLQNFKFRLIYVVEGEEVFVLAFAHLRRRPGYWHNRL